MPANFIWSADLLKRKQTHFVLWRPRIIEPVPNLYIGSSSDLLENFQEIPLKRSTQFPDQDDLWEVAAQECNLRGCMRSIKSGSNFDKSKESYVESPIQLT